MGNLPFVHSVSSLMQPLKQEVSFGWQVRIHSSNVASHLVVQISLRSSTLNIPLSSIWILFTEPYNMVYMIYLNYYISITHGHSWNESNSSSWQVTTTSIGINLSKFIFVILRDKVFQNVYTICEIPMNRNSLKLKLWTNALLRKHEII